MGLNITLMSYLDKIDVGIVADRDQMPDVHRLLDWLADGVAELMPSPAVAVPPSSSPRRPPERGPVDALGMSPDLPATDRCTPDPARLV